MADQIEINIYLKDSVDGTGRNNEPKSPTDKLDQQQQKQQKALQNIGKYVASKTVGTFLQNTKGAISSNIGLITGKQQLQEKVNFAMSTAQEMSNIVSAGASTSALFTVAGLSGGVGLAVGVALQFIQTSLNIYFKQRQLDILGNLENKQINQTLSRYGANYNRSRSGI